MGTSLLNIGTRALLSNQVALQTTGNNISNVNTPGYSRQTAQLQAVTGQFTGGGFVGKGVQVATITRSSNEFLTNQASSTASVASLDATRATRLLQLEDLFPTGDTGLGTSVSNLFNAFSDVANTPTDLSARSVALSSADALAARFRDTANQLEDMTSGVRLELNDAVSSMNALSQHIASLNEQIATAMSTGHTPNDLLDQRDQAVKDLSGYAQTTTLKNSDGSINVYLGSQPLVLNTRTSTVELAGDEFGDLSKIKLLINNAGLKTTVDENAISGGSAIGLLRFNNNDLAQARNLTGRMSLALQTTLNTQHQVGVDLDGNSGVALFAAQALPASLAASTNTGTADIATTVSDPTAMVASDYELRFGAGGSFDVIRLADGQMTSYPGPLPVTVDGLTFSLGSGAAAAGDRYLVKPFSAAAAGMRTAISSPRSLAVASPVQANVGASNTGNLTVQGVVANTPDANLTQPVTLTFTAAGTFDVSGTGTGNPTGLTYVAGQSISYNGWTLTLKGTPAAGDTITVQASSAAYRARDGSNATALNSIRNTAMFDGAPAAEGYANVLARVGTLSQAAQYASTVSSTIANSAASAKASVTGVNLDEEAAKLLQYQQAYQASAKMVQIAQSIFDSLLQGM
jgi:flagellar hook-associated protein 1 FlgK